LYDCTKHWNVPVRKRKMLCCMYCVEEAGGHRGGAFDVY
jgi:hypothetical protein